MLSNKINTDINKYLKLKYNIPALNETEKTLINNSISNLNDYFNLEKINLVIDSFYSSINSIKETLSRFDNNLSVGKFYLGSIYRDLYFCFANGVSTTCMVQIDEKSSIKISFLTEELDLFCERINEKTLITEIIDELENTIDKINNFC